MAASVAFQSFTLCVIEQRAGQETITGSRPHAWVNAIMGALIYEGAMSYNTKAEAKQACMATKKMLKGRWRSRIWENLGWHWELRQGAIAVHKNEGCSTSKRFWAGVFYDVTESFAYGPWVRGGTGYGRSPTEAIESALSAYRAYREKELNRYAALDASLDKLEL